MNSPTLFYDNFFRVNFLFFYCWDYISYEKYLNSNFGLIKDLKGYSGSFECLEKYNKRIHLIWVAKSKNSITDLAHECLHAANFILEQAGVIPDFKNDETQAYYLRLIMNECLNGYENKQKKNKKTQKTKQNENKK